MKLFTKNLFKQSIAALATLATLWGPSGVVSASPAQAQSIAERMAVRLAAERYAVTPIAFDVLGQGQTANHFLRIEPGVDYAVTVGGDTDALNIDLVIYDEFGQEVVRDTRLGPFAGATFRATYAGQVKVIVIMRQARTLGAYCLLQCSRTGLRMPMPAPASTPSGN